MTRAAETMAAVEAAAAIESRSLSCEALVRACLDERIEDGYIDFVDDLDRFPCLSLDGIGEPVDQLLSRFRSEREQRAVIEGLKTGAVDIVIDTKSVNTGSATFNEHIQGEDFLDTARHPTATFKSTKVIFEGDKPTAIEGNLTLKGVTRPVTLTVTSFQAMPHPMLKKDAIGANAHTMVKRSEFNAGKYAPNVGDDVRIDIAIEAIKQ